MKRAVLPVIALAGLALPAGASGRVVELGSNADPAAKSACPADPCEVFASSTGYMARTGATRNPYVIRRAGRIVAFTVQLGKLEDNQVDFFNQSFYGPPSVRISILRKGDTRQTRLNHRLLRQSELYQVRRYLGSDPTFALDEPLAVSRGHIVAMTTPTWVPAFVSGLPKTNWWRSSRARRQCGSDDVRQRAAQDRPGSVRTYGCTYFRARLQYTVTYIPDPRTTD
jgi:hypothetical protein